MTSRLGRGRTDRVNQQMLRISLFSSYCYLVDLILMGRSLYDGSR